MSLNSEDWNQITEIFGRALEVETALRGTLVREATRNRPDLEREVLDLIAAHEKSSGFLEKPLGGNTLLHEELEGQFAEQARREGFEILSMLGSGSFATVYLAQELALQRKVALKATRGASLQGLSHREAHTLASLEHENIVRVFSVTQDQERDTRWIVMQYVPGGTLETLLSAYTSLREESDKEPMFLEVLARLPTDGCTFDATLLRYRDELRDSDFVDGILRIGIQLADALEHAHQHGVLHLDLKPANILITPYGRALLTDFNVSIDAQTIGAGEARGLGGTPRYMAPEQSELFNTANRKQALQSIGPSSDIFSLGRVLEEVQGARPYADPALRKITDRCLQSDPGLRFESAAELASALRRALELRRVFQKSHALNGLATIVRSAPVLSVIAAAAVPQFAGSLAQYTYSWLRVAIHLNEAQQAAFHKLMAWFNFSIYPMAMLVFYFWIWPSRQVFKERLPMHVIDRIHSRLLKLPAVFLAVAATGWLPAIFIFPTTIGWLSSPLDQSAWVGFGVGFLLAVLIATTFSLLFTQYLIVHHFYPALLLQSLGIRSYPRGELSRIRRINKLLPSAAALVPMAGALLAVLNGEASFTSQSFRGFQLLVVMLIGVGISGLLVSTRLSSVIERRLRELA